MFAKVEEGAVAQMIKVLPKSYTFGDGSKTGNFDEMPDAVHISEGYYPVEDVIPVFNADYEETVLSSTAIQADKVVRTYTKQYKDLDEMKAAKLEMLERVRQDKLHYGTFAVGAPVNGTFVFRNNGEGQTTVDIMKAKMASDAGLLDLATFSWTDSSGEEVVLGVLGFPVFMAAAATYEATVDGVAKYKRAEIKALSTQEEVAAYDVNAGW